MDQKKDQMDQQKNQMGQNKDQLFKLPGIKRPKKRPTAFWEIDVLHTRLATKIKWIGLFVFEQAQNINT